MGVPSSTRCPSSTRNSINSASETATETRGMRMTKSAMGIRSGGGKGALRGGNDARRRRIDLSFERSGRGGRDEPGADALDGRFQVAETLRLQYCHDLGSRPGELD